MRSVQRDNPEQFEWQKPVQEALLELDPARLKAKVADAEAAVFERLQELSEGSGNGKERQALQDASNALRLLKRDVLKYPDWRPD